MFTKQLKYRLLETPKTLYGLRQEGDKYFIGNKHVKIKDNNLIIDTEKFLLTQGLLDLLTKNKLENLQSLSDLNKYKCILLLTNVHRRGFNANEQIVAASGWKYRNVISKLFPPNRSYASKISSKKEILNTRFEEDDDNDNENTQDLMAYDDVNELVERFRYLHETDSTANRREIMRILKELERLGVIEFR